jgi:MoxR-like ATPase
MSLLDAPVVIERVRATLGKVLEGKSDVIDLVLVGILGGGHVLIEDVPGVGKTTLAKAVARAFDIQFARVQFTPDLLPSDIVGAQILNPREGTLTFQRGPLFANVLLADEINRASPRTQSALLEAMNEGQATVDGVSHPLPKPFFVLATQNPSDFSGTYPLPEAQLDRFLLRVSVGYPSAEAELRMLFARQTEDPLDHLVAVATRDDLLLLQARARDTTVQPDVAKYMLRLIAATRDAADLEVGASPRASLALFRAAQAHALLHGRSYVSPVDVQALAAPVLAHRVKLTSQARYGGRGEAAIFAELVASVDVPV